MIEQSPLKNSIFLAKRYPQLSKSPEVLRAVGRHEKRSGVAVENKPEARIQVYLDRFSEILARPEQQDRERGIEALKKVLSDKFVIKIDDVPESYWRAQMKLERNRGKGGDWQSLSDVEVAVIKQEHLKQAIQDQKGSLEEWIDFLASENSHYLPDYLKYWAFAGMLKLDRFEKQADKETGDGRFPERPTGRQRSVKMFPELNERGLEFFAKAHVQKSQSETITFRHDIPQEARDEFLALLRKNDFRLVYSWLQEHIPPITKEELKTVEGVWVQYVAGEEKKLTEALRGKGSGWCIAGAGLATKYLLKGVVHIYFTKDLMGEMTNPRVVITEDEKRVSQVRGIEWEENIDPYISQTSIISEKLAQLPGGDKFESTDRDVKLLTLIDLKMAKGQPLTAKELLFLYEVHEPIRYFGYEKDPRIEELRAKRDVMADFRVINSVLAKQKHTEVYQTTQDTLQIMVLAEKTKRHLPFTQEELKFFYMIDRQIILLPHFRSQIDELYIMVRESRNLKEDAAVILGVLPQEIAWGQEAITANTKVYVGELFPGIFAEHQNFEKIYTSFPRGEVVKSALTLGIKSPSKLVADLAASNILLYKNAQQMILSPEFLLQTRPSDIAVRRLLRGVFGQAVTVVKLKISDLGFEDSVLTETMFAKAKEFGLEPCNPEVGPQYRLQHVHSNEDPILVGMKSLVASNQSEIFVINLGGNARQKPALDSWSIKLWRHTDIVLFQVKTK